MTDEPDKTDPDRARVTLRRIAKEADVSISTASRALSGSTAISESVRIKVREIAERLAWTSSATGQPTVTVLTPINTGAPGTPDFQQELLAGIESACTSIGVPLSVSLVTPGRSSGKGTFDAGSGYVLLSLEDEELVARLSSAGVPAVIVNGSDPLMRLDAVTAGNRSGGYAAMRHLIGLGHRRVLRLVYSPRRPVRERFEGARMALMEAGLPDDPNLDIDLADMRADRSYIAVRDRLAAAKGRPDFTAIQCCNDAAALGALAAISEAGLRVPQDISVIGFDDLSTAALSNPPLTTIRVARHEIGGLGLRRLLERVRNPDLPIVHTEIAAPLIVRSSTGPAP